jgi:hypothetical protein
VRWLQYDQQAKLSVSRQASSTIRSKRNEDKIMQNVLGHALVCFGTIVLAAGIASRARGAEEKKLPLIFSGGHDIGKNEFGRPVPLIAAALGVKQDEFRKAFSGVTPARGGPPSASQARKNKEALMKVLGPLGVSNDRLDEVSDYYRYQPQKGELWPTTAAEGYAVVSDGKLQKLVVTLAGSGYCSPPKVTIKGMETLTLEATLHVDKEFEKNGAVESIKVVDAPKATRRAAIDRL